MTKKKKLPDANEPIVLSDGSKPEVLTVEKTQNFVKVPTNKEAVQQVMATKRRLADMATPPKELNAVLLVASYYFMGMDDFDTAVATGLTEEQVGNIKMTQVFEEMIKNISENIVATGLDDVRNMIAASANKAARKISSLAMHENPEIAMSASKDILDRAGFRPADVVEHRTKIESSLRIEVIRKDETQRIPTIENITPQE